MATTFVSTEQDVITAEIQIAAPPERIFQALTDPAQLQQWFTNAECPVKFWEFDARLDGAYRYTTAPGDVVVNGTREFKCHGHVTEFDPPKVLAYTWFANWHDDHTARTVVRWELTPREDGTHVKVTHSGLANLPIARKDYSGGWPGVVEQLKKFFEK
jgi:glutathione S-transferase